MQIEDVTGVGLAARGATQQQRHRAVGLGLLREVVKDDQDVLAVVHPVLPDSRAGVGRQVLEARRVRRRCRNDRGVLHRAGLVERVAGGGDRRALLADRHVDAADLLSLVAGLPVVTLVDDGVEADRALAGLAVADDELALAAADRRHGVDCLDAGQQWLADLLALHHRGRLQFESSPLVGLDLALAVDGLAQRVDDPAEVGVADRHRKDLAGAPHLLPFRDLRCVTEDDDADLAHVEVQRDAQRAALELEQLVRHRARQPFDAGDAVAGLCDDADFLARGLWRIGRDVALDRATDLVCGDRQLCHQRFPCLSRVFSVSVLSSCRASPRGLSVRLPAGRRCCRR